LVFSGIFIQITNILPTSRTALSDAGAVPSALYACNHSNTSVNLTQTGIVQHQPYHDQIDPTK
jgi:hypothetical protein